MTNRLSVERERMLFEAQLEKLLKSNPVPREAIVRLAHDFAARNIEECRRAREEGRACVDQMELIIESLRTCTSKTEAASRAPEAHRRFAEVDRGFEEISSEFDLRSHLVNEVLGLAKIQISWLQREQAPPRLPETILAFVARTPQQKNALGDLNEKFIRWRSKVGQSRATIYYWAEAVQLVWEISRSTLRRILHWVALYVSLRWFGG
jgi:hypothetical protein